MFRAFTPQSFSAASTLKRIASISFALIFLACSAMSSLAQTITWATPQQDTTTAISGASGAAGATATVFSTPPGTAPGTALWVAYEETTVTDSYGDALIGLAYNTDGGVNFGNKHLAEYGISGDLSTNVMPAVTTFNGLMYLGFSSYSYTYDGTNVYDAQFAWSSDGIHFSSPSYACGDQSASEGADGSPSFAVFNGYLYMTYRNHATHAMVLCKISSNNTTTVTDYGNITANFAPTLAVFKGKLYAATESDNTSHTIYLYTSTDGSTFTINDGASSDQTSRAPSMAVHNGYLYLAFRENDSSDELLYKYSADGNTFSSAINAHWQNNGPPILLQVDGLPSSPYNGDLFEFFASFSPTHLCSNHGN